MIERKILLQIGVNRNAPIWANLHDLRIEQALEHRPRLLPKLALVMTGFVTIVDEFGRCSAPSRTATEHLNEQTVANLELRRQGLGWRYDDSLEELLVPCNVTAFRRLLLDDLLALARILGGFGFQLQILDYVLGRLGNHAAPVIESAPPRAPSDLMKIPRPE